MELVSWQAAALPKHCQAQQTLPRKPKQVVVDGACGLRGQNARCVASCCDCGTPPTHPWLEQHHPLVAACKHYAEAIVDSLPKNNSQCQPLSSISQFQGRRTSHQEAPCWPGESAAYSQLSAVSEAQLSCACAAQTLS
jgi:hypothetical protein